MKRRSSLALFLGLFSAVHNSLRNCNEQNLGREECLRIPGYSHFQWARCSDDNYIKNISNGKERCLLGQDTNITHYCWYPCQRKFSNETENEVEDERVHSECLCRDEDKVWKYDWTRYIAVKNNKNVDPNVLEMKNCSYLNDGEKLCGHHRDYTRNQWIQCVSDSHLHQKSKGRFRCRENKLFCWLPCQLDKYGLDEGEVNNDCFCSKDSDTPSSSSVLLGGGFLLWTTILILLMTW